MGRTEKSQGLAPPAIRKDLRAKQARHIINKVIPAILTSNPRARKGTESSELIVDPGPASRPIPTANANGTEEAEQEAQYIKRKGQGRRKAKPPSSDETITRAGHEKEARPKGSSRNKRKDSLSDSSPSPPAPTPQTRIRILVTDTLTAAHMLTFPSRYPPPAVPTPVPALAPSRTTSKKKTSNTCILNMSSPLRPGGGVLSGATSQEEFLCARTTLLPSLKESFYRLPEMGAIYTSDVLVFRSSLPLASSAGGLGPGERYWVDVVSAGMLRFPELEGEGEGEGLGRLGKRDREAVEGKMRAVMRIAVRKGVRRIVLGAWGCGAYGNPVADVARAWKRVLEGDVGGSGSGSGSGSRRGKRGKEHVGLEKWDGVEEVVFAITGGKMAAEFSKAFGGGIEVERGPAGDIEDEEDDEEDQVAQELRSKIQEMESQLSKVWNPDLKARMGTILEGLRGQLRERERGGEDVGEEGQDDSGEGEEGEEEGESPLDEDNQDAGGDDVNETDKHTMEVLGS